MSDLGSQVYNLSMQKLITLWVIDFRTVIGLTTATDGLLYISGQKNVNDNIVFNNNTYDFVGVTASGFRSELNGQLPEPLLTIDKNALLKVEKYKTIRDEYRVQNQELYFDWRGARITRIRITDNLLPEPSKGEYQHYIVNQVNQSTKSTIDIQLSVSLAADKINNKSVQELAPNRCALKYRLWDSSKNQFVYTDEKEGGCPYGNPTSRSDWGNVPDFGNLYFDDNDLETEKENDRCSFSVKGCQLRFDPDEFGLVLPFVGLYKQTSNDPKQNPQGLLPNG